jgi:hypothetical protein
MKKRRGYETEVIQGSKTATGVVKFPGKGRVQKKLFRDTVYCSAKTKAEQWIRETVNSHREATDATSLSRIEVRELETEWWVNVECEGGFQCKAVKRTRDEAMEEARVYAEQGRMVIVEQVSCE